MSTTPEEVEVSRNVSGTQAAAVVVGLVLLLAVAWFFFLRGGNDEAALIAPPVVTPAPVASPEASEEPIERPGKGPLETFEVFAPKDPFRPLISVGSTGAPSGAVAVAPGTTGTPPPGTTSGTGQPSGGSDISGGGSGGGRGSQVGGHRIRLIDTFQSNGRARARVQVDGTVYTVGEGDRFADNFELVSISGDCASILFGDDQFSLCEGEEILK